MSVITEEIGQRIRQFRQGRRMTLDELASAVHKSRATLSKYERGEISMDIETLYDIARALNVRTEQLLCVEAEDRQQLREVGPAFFQGLSRFYCYHFDGRNGKLTRSVFDIFSPIEVNRYKIAMYMNCDTLGNYQRCENTYWGYIEHFDALSLIELTNQDNPMEKASLQVLASFLDAETKWALWNGVSSRPLMPVAVKMLLSKKPLDEDAALTARLKLFKEDINRMKYYNMFSVV